MLSSLAVAFVALASSVSSTPSCSYTSPAEAARVDQAFLDAKIVPDVIPTFQPNVQVFISYGSTAVDLGTYSTILGLSYTPIRTPLPTDTS